MYTGQPPPMQRDIGVPIVFNRPPPRSPPRPPLRQPPRSPPRGIQFPSRGNQSPPRGNQPPWMNNRPLQPSQQTNFQENKQFQQQFENNNKAMRPKVFPSRKNPGKPRPLKTSLNQEQKSRQDQLTENDQNVPPPSHHDMGAF